MNQGPPSAPRAARRPGRSGRAGWRDGPPVRRIRLGGPSARPATRLAGRDADHGCGGADFTVSHACCAWVRRPFRCTTTPIFNPGRQASGRTGPTCARVWWDIWDSIGPHDSSVIATGTALWSDDLFCRWSPAAGRGTVFHLQLQPAHGRYRTRVRRHGHGQRDHRTGAQRRVVCTCSMRCGGSRGRPAPSTTR